MKKHLDITVEPAVTDYLSSRLQADADFLAERQGSLNVSRKDENATWQYLQGKRDMCKQVLLYLEEIQRLPKVEIPAVTSESPRENKAPNGSLFSYPEDYDTNE